MDHATESWINPATSQLDALRHDTVDCMTWIQLKLMGGGKMVHSWKRDVKRAFKRVPIRVSHLDLAGAVWMVDGEYWMSEHVGMPFGTMSAGAG